jgi:iron complex transport system ATP-binding protein
MSIPALHINALRLLRPDGSGVPLLQVDELSLEAGHWTALVGPNGAGKSTLMRALASAQHLGIWLDGKPLNAWTTLERAQRVAWLPQTGASPGASLTVQQLVMLGRVPWTGLLRGPDHADLASVENALQALGLDALAKRPFASLSGGEQQLVLIARVLATEAPVMLLDEPVSHLDAPHQRRLMNALRQRCERGACALVVLHDLNLALQADAVLVVHEGRALPARSPGDPRLQADLVRAFGQAIEVLQHPDGTRWIATLV